MPDHPVAPTGIGRSSRASVVNPNLDKPERTRSATRNRVLDAAARVFREQGYGARLSEIAEAAGLQAGSLYYHFESREALVEEALRLGLERSWDHVEVALGSVPDDAGAGERLRVALAAHLRSILEVSDYSAANSRIFSMAPDEVRDRHYRLQQRYGEVFHQLLVEAIDAGQLRPDVDPAVMRMLLFGAMNWTAERYRPDRGRPAEAVIDQMLRLVDGMWAPAGS